MLRVRMLHMCSTSFLYNTIFYSYDDVCVRLLALIL